MRLVGFGAGGWALFDEARAIRRHIAGPLSAWAPRLAGGETVCALPLTGRTETASGAQPLKRAGFRRILAPPDIQVDGAMVAAVVGVSLVGRSNPFRSVCGYVGIGSGAALRMGPALVTRDEVGDEPPEVVQQGHASALKAALQLLDCVNPLQTGDIVLLGALSPESQLFERLWCAFATPARD